VILLDMDNKDSVLFTDRGVLDHLVTGRPCAHTTAREGRLTVEVTLAIEHSARTGEAVKFPFHEPAST
jgi:hypothetical protein